MSTKTWFGILIITAILLSQARAQVPFTNSLVAYYPFNGNANDASGKSNNLTDYGATLCPDRFGNTNQAYSFNGSSYLGTSIPPLTQIDNCTLTAWIQLASLNENTVFAMCLGENAELNNGFGFGVSGGNQLYALYPGTSFAPDNYVFTSTSQWYQVVMVRNSDVASFYVNGVATATTFSTTVASPTEFEIGSAGDRFSYFDFAGAIDDVRVYNRALSATEVQELYAYESVPQPCLPAATSTVVDGYVTAVTVTNGGCGLTNTPLVLIEGGGGTGATAIAVVENGVVSQIIITDAGIGYSSAPAVYIGEPPAVSTPPQAVAADAGDTVALSVSITGSAPLSYQWLLNGTNLADNDQITGSQSNMVTLTDITMSNAGTYEVIVTNIFGSTNASAVLTVAQGTPIVTWSQPTPVINGTALSSNQLNAMASVPGSFAYTPASGTVLNAGTQTLSVVFTPTDTIDYGSVTDTVSLDVLASVSIAWSNAAPIMYGTPLDTNQLNATASVPGNFVYAPPAGTVLNVGTNVLSAIFTPTDTADYDGATNNISVVVLPAPLTMTATSFSRAFDVANPVFTGTIVGIQNGDNISVTYNCSATTNSPIGLYPIVQTLIDPNSRLTNYTLTVNNGTLTVNQGIPQVAWVNPAPIVYGTSLSSNQLNASANVLGSLSYSPAGGAVLYVGTNTLSVVFIPNDTTDYIGVTDTVSLVVSPAPLTVTANSATRLYGQTNPTFSGTIVGIQNGDNITAAYSCTAVNNSPSGTYPIIPTLVDPSDLETNYTVILNDGSLTVNPIPIILTQPQGQTAPVGGSVTFSITTGGTGPFTYQWQFNGSNVALPTTSPTLTISNLSAINAGNYAVVVSNPYDSVTSSMADLQVSAGILVNGQLATGTVSSVGSAQITINTVFPGGFVFYTLDGSAPSTGSSLYTAPFTLTNSAIIQTFNLSADFSQAVYSSPVIVQIVPLFNLVTSVVGSGTINANPTNNPYVSNSVVVLTATPATYWTFDHWTGDASGNQNPLSVTMDSPHSVQAVFVQSAYPLTVSTAGGGSVTINGLGITPYSAAISGLYNTGVNSSGVALPGGSTDPHWILGGTVTGTPYVLSPGSTYSQWTPDDTNSAWIGIYDSAYEPTDVPYYFNETFSLAGFDPGTAVLSGTWWGDDNTSIELNGHVIASSGSPNLTGIAWTVTDTGVESGWFNPGMNTLTVEMNSSDGVYDGVRVAVTGTATTLSPNTYYQIGDVVTLAATASNGWSFIDWQGDASGTNNPLSLTVTQTNNIQAIFGTTVNTNTIGGGNIVLNQPNPVPYGTTLTASAVPTAGNYFVTWSGAASGTNSPTTVAVTNANPTIDALFTTLPGGKYSLAVVIAGNGTVAISPQQNYYSAGARVTLTASTTNAGTSFSGWTGAATGSNNPLTVVVSSNMVVQANFGAAPTVTISPESVIVLAGGNVTLSANASGLPPLTYQWQNGQGAIAGQTNATFAITNVQATNAGNYSVVVSNPYGSVTSVVATVTVVFPPSITTQPIAQTVAAAGSSVTLSVTASGTAPLVYQWFNSGGAITGATNSELVLNPALTNYSDNYAVVISNAYGVATSETAAVFVFSPVTIETQPSSLVVAASAPAMFSVAATGFPSPNSYQWTLNGTNIAGATSSSLLIAHVQLTNLGNYQVSIGNGYSTTNSGIATLEMSPSINSPFTGATPIWGTSAILSIGAIGSGQLSYQWYLGGVAINGATNSTLDFTSVQFTNGGLYSVVISSPYGSVTNAPEQVVVEPAGVSLGFAPTLTISGVAGYSYIIQSTTNLGDTNSWVTVTNLTLTQAVQLWADTNVNASSPFNPKRFYQVLPGQ